MKCDNNWESYNPPHLKKGDEIIRNLANGQPYIGIKIENHRVPIEITKIEFMYGERNNDSCSYILSFRKGNILNIKRDSRDESGKGSGIYEIDKEELCFILNKDEKKLNNSFSSLKKQRGDLAEILSKCMNEFGI